MQQLQKDSNDKYAPVPAGDSSRGGTEGEQSAETSCRCDSRELFSLTGAKYVNSFYSLRTFHSTDRTLNINFSQFTYSDRNSGHQLYELNGLNTKNLNSDTNQFHYRREN